MNKLSRKDHSEPDQRLEMFKHLEVGCKVHIKLGSSRYHFLVLNNTIGSPDDKDPKIVLSLIKKNPILVSDEPSKQLEKQRITDPRYNTYRFRISDLIQTGATIVIPEEELLLDEKIKYYKLFAQIIFRLFSDKISLKRGVSRR